jgi:hypothetical protein
MSNPFEWQDEIAAERRMDAQEMRQAMQEVNLLTILKISADNRESLRPQDVDRVMTQADDCGVLDRFREWLLSAKTFTHGTRTAIEEWPAP